MTKECNLNVQKNEIIFLLTMNDVWENMRVCASVFVYKNIGKFN